MNKKKLVVLTGAGISAESGIPTFRSGVDGLWNNMKVDDIATPEGFSRNPQMVLDFYNKMHKDLPGIRPNYGHIGLKELEEDFNVTVITQNVDDLHEKAGSSKIIHLHGELSKYCTEGDTLEGQPWPWDKELKVGEVGENGTQVRPFIIWFGEAVPNLNKAITEAYQADIFLIIGTSLEVYPAASLIEYVPYESRIYVIDPNPKNSPYRRDIINISKEASEGMKEFIKMIRNDNS